MQTSVVEVLCRRVRDALRASLPVALVCSAALAQRPGTGSEFEVSLSAPVSIVRAGEKAELVLRLATKDAVTVPSVLLGGTALKTSIANKAGPSIEDAVAGNTRLGAHASVSRSIFIDTSLFASRMQRTGFTEVHFEWSGLRRVKAIVGIAPDLRETDVDDLDLARTRVVLLTSHGEMLLKFRPDKAPKTVRNFVKLAKDQFYDGTRFHRVVRGFIIHGGCPNTRAGSPGVPGSGGPGYTIEPEFNDISHLRGVLSMARGKREDSAGSQFFVMHDKATELDGKYTAFGYLASGEDTLDKIANVNVGAKSRWTPNEPVRLKLAVVWPVFKASR